MTKVSLNNAHTTSRRVASGTLVLLAAACAVASLEGCSSTPGRKTASSKTTPATASAPAGAQPRTYARLEPLNGENGPGGNVVVDTLTPTASEAARERHPYEGPSPSVLGVDRSNWQETRFLVPVSGVNHHPHYTDDKPRFARQTARARGEYPTQATVLETGNHKFTDQGGSLALEGVAAPIRAMWDILKFPVVATRRGNRPYSVVQSPIPAEAYARGPALRSQWAGQQAQLKKTITGTPLPGAKPIAPAETNVPTTTPPANPANPANPVAPTPSPSPTTTPPEAATPPASTAPSSAPPERTGTPGSFKPKPGSPPAN